MHLYIIYIIYTYVYIILVIYIYVKKQNSKLFTFSSWNLYKIIISECLRYLFVLLRCSIFYSIERSGFYDSETWKCKELMNMFESRFCWWTSHPVLLFVIGVIGGRWIGMSWMRLLFSHWNSIAIPRVFKFQPFLMDMFWHQFVLTFEQSNGFHDFGAEKQCCLEMAAVEVMHSRQEVLKHPGMRRPWPGRFDGARSTGATSMTTTVDFGVFVLAKKQPHPKNNILLLVPCWTLMVEFWKQFCFRGGCN